MTPAAIVQLMAGVSPACDVTVPLPVPVPPSARQQLLEMLSLIPVHQSTDEVADVGRNGALVARQVDADRVPPAADREALQLPHRSC